MKLLGILAVGLIGFVGPGTSAHASSPAFQITVVLRSAAPGHALLDLDSPPSRGSLAHHLVVAGVRHAEPFYRGRTTQEPLAALVSRMWRLTLAPGRDPNAVAANLAADPRIQVAEWRGTPRLHYTPNDPDYPEQWHLPHVRADLAWDAIRGDATRDAVIGVVDTGLEWEHPDIAANLWVNGPEDLDQDGRLSPADLNGIDDDQNGFVDDVIGWDFGADDNDPAEDDVQHGTSVAAAASEVTDNGLLGAGLGFAARLLPVKFFTPQGQVVDAYEGMIYACENGADVVNCSWGTSVYSEAEQLVVTAIREAGCVVTASAGANGDTPLYPAAYDDVLAVTATDPFDHKASFAGFGTWVDVCAPGVDIRLAHGEDDFSSFSGTSYACALVAGFTALLRARYPEVGPADLETFILETAVDIDSLNPTYAGLLGAGRIDVAPAVVTTVPSSRTRAGGCDLAVAPNPANPRAIVTVVLATATAARLQIHDLQGRRVRTLHHGGMSAGRHAVVWNGDDDSGAPAPSGIYVVRLNTKVGNVARRLALVR